ncbi:MAG: CHAT domain-containing protein [Leptolyngbyaceae cyanobacterium]
MSIDQTTGLSVEAEEPPTSNWFYTAEVKENATSDQLAEADRLVEQAIQQYGARQLEEARQSYETALELYRRPEVQAAFPQESRLGEGRSLHNLGLVYRAQGDTQRAIELYEQSLAIFRELNDRLRETIALGSLGNVYSVLGQYPQAIGIYEDLLAISEESNNLQQKGATLNILSELYRNLGAYEQSLEYAEQQLMISLEINNLLMQALATLRTGLIKFSVVSQLDPSSLSLQDQREILSSYQEILQLHEGALSLFDRILVSPSGVQNLYGRPLTEQDIAYVRQLKNLAEGLVSNVQGVFIRAQEFLEQSESREGLLAADELSDELSSDLQQVSQTGLEQAVDIYQQRLTIARQNGDRSEEAGLLGSLGRSYRNLDQFQRALALYGQQLAIVREINEVAGEGFALSNIGQIFNDQGLPEVAILFLKASVQVRESIRSNLSELDSELQQSYTDTIADDYRLLADLLLEQGRIPEAQQVLDLLKLEELREFTDTRAVWTSDGLQLTTAEQTVADAHDSLIALGADLIDCERNNCADLDTLYDRQETLLAQYDREVTRFTATIRDNRADDEVFANPDNISGDAQDLLEAYAAEGETALLIYPFVLEDKLWLVWATVGNVIGSIEVPVARGELSTTVQRLGELLQTGDTRNIADLQATSQQLYNWLIAPLEAELAANDIDDLSFVNDRVTRYIPMAVLHDGEQYLLERYTLSTVLAPGATEMGDRLSTVAESPVLGLGVTQPIGDFNALPAVGAELAAIVQDAGGNGIYPGQVFLDDAFTLETLRSNVAAHRVLHIATHAEFVPGRKEDSYILLGDGSPLRIPDIEQLERRWRNIHLVVLSACQTALGGPDQDGAEIAGLSSYFLEENRAEAVIASLWSVNDASTSVLMQRFYALLATGEFTKAEALRQAQLSLLKGEDLETLENRLATRAGAPPQLRAGVELPPDIGHRHPYYWAPFILIGNGL